MIRYLGCMFSMGIIMAFGTTGILSVVHNVVSWHFFELLFVFAVALSWLVTLAITNCD